MTTVIIILAIWGIYRLLKGTAERRQHREMEKLKQEQIWQREEQRQMREEQEKQADEIAKLKHTIEQARFDIDYLLERIGSIDTQTDYYIYLQSATVPGGDEWCKYQRRIDTLKAQAHAAETRLSKAKFQKEQAERKLA